MLFLSSQGLQSPLLLWAQVLLLNWRRNHEPEGVWFAAWSQDDRAPGLPTLYYQTMGEQPEGRQVRGRALEMPVDQGRGKEAVRAPESALSISESHSRLWTSLESPGEFQTYWGLTPTPEALIWLLCVEARVRGWLKALQLSWMYSQSCNHWLSRAIC